MSTTTNQQRRHILRCVAACGVALALAACSSTSDESGSRTDRDDTTSETKIPTVADACELITPSQLAEILGQDYGTGSAGLGLAPETRCEFAGGTTGIDVALTVSPGGDGTPSPFQTRTGFESIFGPSTEVSGLPLPAFEHFDTNIVNQASLLATDGHGYLLVTLTGDPVTTASVAQAQAIAAIAITGGATL